MNTPINYSEDGMQLQIDELLEEREHKIYLILEAANELLDDTNNLLNDIRDYKIDIILKCP